ncbi:MAG: SurA N-terminal domain-containing protein [Planctomycetes bacterium]|nr:SurA N-terminal domain-containing protein [Planctomycetota bacterium]
MRRILVAAILLCGLGVFTLAQPRQADGRNEILAVVNGDAITYQEIVGDIDMQAEINATRSIQGLAASVTDAAIERQLVFQRLDGFILQKLLDAEADRVQLKISDAQMRAIVSRERKRLGLDEDDAKGWATYLKEKFNLTPTEYREKMRDQIRRNEIMNYMAGLYGPLPAQYPLEIYFSLSVTPAEVREEFDRDADRWRIARNIDYREFRLIYPGDSLSQDDKRKLISAIVDGEKSVYERVLKNESLEKASEGLEALIEQLGIPGVRIELTERQTAKDDRDLDPTTYQLVLQVPETGGVSDPAAFEDVDEDGQRLEGVKFVKVHSRLDGDRRDFQSPKVQEAIRQRIENLRLVQNRSKVEQALLKRAAIVPDRNFTR